MKTFYEMYFDGDVDFNGDCLDIMEYRHDWATFNFTVDVFKFILFNFFMDIIFHTRAQGKTKFPQILPTRRLALIKTR